MTESVKPFSKLYDLTQRAEKVGISDDDVLREIRIEKIVPNKYQPRREFTEDKIKESYEKNKHQYHLAHILISVKSSSNPNGLSDEEAKKKAEEVLKKVKDGGDFASLAKEYSNDTENASSGGDLGWSSKENTKFVSEFSNAAYSLNKDQVSDVVKTPFGYHIIKVLDTKDSSYDELKTSLEEKAAEQAVKNDSTIVSKALKKLFEEYNVKSDNSDVEAYIKSMLEGSSSN